MTSAGTLTTLHSFDETDGASPEAPLIQATDGNFYSTTYNGGSQGYGTAYKITSGGTLTTLHNFDDDTEGSAIASGLVQASDGNFYGSTTLAGPNGYGAVYKMTSTGTVTVLNSFNATDGATPNELLLGHGRQLLWNNDFWRGEHRWDSLRNHATRHVEHLAYVQQD
jgi:uncharacterized repeat protein (TIGR03803 family)